jgi:hypothetical protein
MYPDLRPGEKYQEEDKVLSEVLSEVAVIEDEEGNVRLDMYDMTQKEEVSNDEIDFTPIEKGRKKK